MSPHLFLCSKFILRLSLIQECNMKSLSNFKELILQGFFFFTLSVKVDKTNALTLLPKSSTLCSFNLGRLLK